MTTVYGIKNCDTVKKALRWWETNNVTFEFHDFKSQGIDATTIQQWIDQLGLEVIVNKRSTTWKQLDEQDRNAINSGNVKNTIALAIASPTLIKRPVIRVNGIISVGFDDVKYQQLFNR